MSLEPSLTPIHPNDLPASSATNPKNALIYPREYYFPPFYTRQTNLTTYHAQCQKWSSWILTYCRHHRIWKLSLVDAVEMDLFWNKRISKRLAIKDAREFLDFMRREGRAEWVGGKGGTADERSLAWIWWRNPEEWAEVIADWVEDTGQKGSVLTLYELMDSESTLSQDFHGMDPELLAKALHILVKRGKAQVFGQEDEQGVKFF